MGEGLEEGDRQQELHEGGELGYSLAHAYGAAFDNPELIVAAVVGDGEAETGPLATAWHSNKFLNPARDGAVLPMDDVVSRYYVRLTVEDRPGVFAKIAGILAKAKIGISSIIQPEGHDGATVPVILMIHDAPNAAMRRALAHIAKLGVVKGEPVMIRVESFE